MRSSLLALFLCVPVTVVSQSVPVGVSGALSTGQPAQAPWTACNNLAFDLSTKCLSARIDVGHRLAPTLSSADGGLPWLMAQNNNGTLVLPATRSSRWPETKSVPIPTQWPNARVEQIPTQWPHLRIKQLSNATVTARPPVN